MAEASARRVPLWPLFVTLLTVLLDQVSKFVVVRYLGPGAPVQSVPLIGSFLRLAYLENTGVSFGQLQGFSRYVTLLNIVIVAGLFIAYRRLLMPSRWANAALGLILGGAVGNIIDRLITGVRLGLDRAYVVDFVDLKYFAVFNVADSAITVGGILYAIYLVFFHRDWPPRKQEEGPPCPQVEEPPPTG